MNREVKWISKGPHINSGEFDLEQESGSFEQGLLMDRRNGKSPKSGNN